MCFYKDPNGRKHVDRLYCYKCGNIQSVLTEGHSTGPERGVSKIIVAILKSKSIISTNYTGNVVIQLHNGGIGQIGKIEYSQEFAD